LADISFLSKQLSNEISLIFNYLTVVPIMLREQVFSNCDACVECGLAVLCHDGYTLNEENEISENYELLNTGYSMISVVTSLFFGSRHYM
jgi:hypothetical protein